MSELRGSFGPDYSALEARVGDLERECKGWQEIARSRKDTKLVDTILALGVELKIAREAVLYEGERAEAAESRIRELEKSNLMWFEEDKKPQRG